MNKPNFLSKFILAAATTMALVACGGGGNDSTDTTTPSSQLVPRGNVNDAKAAYDRVVDGMTLEQAMVFLGKPDYINEGTIVSVYQWAFADGTILQLGYKNGRLWRKVMGNMNQTLVNHQYF